MLSSQNGGSLRPRHNKGITYPSYFGTPGAPGSHRSRNTTLPYNSKADEAIVSAVPGWRPYDIAILVPQLHRGFLYIAHTIARRIAPVADKFKVPHDLQRVVLRGVFIGILENGRQPPPQETDVSSSITVGEYAGARCTLPWQSRYLCTWIGLIFYLGPNANPSLRCDDR